MRLRKPRRGGRRPDRAGAAAALLAVGITLCAPASSGAQGGQVQCIVTANGAPATGTIAIAGPGAKETAGTCGAPIQMEAGRWKATVRLDGALDNPLKQVDVNVTAGKATRVSVDFEIGTLEVQIRAKGASGTGMVTVKRGSQRVGTLGAGVAAQLSAGKYEVTVQYDGREKRYAVTLQPGQRRVLRAQF